MMTEYQSIEEIGQANSERINLALRNHQTDVRDWDFSATVSDLHRWAERMIEAFKLQIPVPCLGVGALRRAYGRFHYGRNGFGIRDEIVIEENHIRRSPYWRVLGTELHELLHSWQQRHGKAGRGKYHNIQYRDKARSLGLIVDVKGVTHYAPGDTPFLTLLNKYGIETPKIPPLQEPPSAQKGSRLKLWECPCGVKVRVGRSSFNAQCLDCGGLFQKQATDARFGNQEESSTNGGSSHEVAGTISGKTLGTGGPVMR